MTGKSGGETWHDILITDVGSERNAQYAGYRLDELADVWRLSPARAAIRLLVEEELRVDCAFFTMSEDDVATVLTADFCCIGSDASARAFEGPTALRRPASAHVRLLSARLRPLRPRPARADR